MPTKSRIEWPYVALLVGLVVVLRQPFICCRPGLHM